MVLNNGFKIVFGTHTNTVNPYTITLPISINLLTVSINAAEIQTQLKTTSLMSYTNTSITLNNCGYMYETVLYKNYFIVFGK